MQRKQLLLSNTISSWRRILLIASSFTVVLRQLNVQLLGKFKNGNILPEKMNRYEDKIWRRIVRKENEIYDFAQSLFSCMLEVDLVKLCSMLLALLLIANFFLI